MTTKTETKAKHAPEERQPRFAIGTKFQPYNRKHPRECTVVDILRTYNGAGEMVALRYVATYQLMGQIVTMHDVVETTIARSLTAKAEGRS